MSKLQLYLIKGVNSLKHGGLHMFKTHLPLSENLPSKMNIKIICDLFSGGCASLVKQALIYKEASEIIKKVLF